MKTNVEYIYSEHYLPTKRHRNARTRDVKGIAEVEIRELKEKDFPVAFLVRDYDNDEYQNFVLCDKEIRYFDGKLWKAIKYAEKRCGVTGWWPKECVKGNIESSTCHCGVHEPKEPFTEKSILLSDSKEEMEVMARRLAGKYVIYDDKVWEPCGEPMYYIVTLGLGHNHGGTSFGITYHYNPNISKNNYFNALHREEAIAYGKQVAANRGDTESIERMGKYDEIIVLMPELVKRDPEKDHGEGNPLLNQFERVIRGSSSSMEAGLLAMATAMSAIK